MKISTNIDHFNKIGVFGVGLSGVSAIKALRSLNFNVEVVNDDCLENWPNNTEILKYVDKASCFSTKHFDCSSLDLLVLSPGIPRTHELVEECLSRGIKVWSEIELAYQLIKNNLNNKKLIAVTGTNGKTTSVLLIKKLLELAGINNFIGGNIGLPFCEILTNDKLLESEVICLELSSFQLESIESFKPDLAFITNLTMSHGERYENIDDYAIAKWNIQKNMNSDDSFYIHPTVDKFKFKTNASIKRFPEDNFKVKLTSSFNIEKFKLPGPHNLENLWACYLVKEYLQIPDKYFNELICTFKPVEHRIELLDRHYNFKIYNDSKSTNCDSTKVAINSFDGNIDLILGGKLRGSSDSIKPILDLIYQKCRKVYVFGEAARLIESEVVKIPCIVCSGLDDIKSRVIKDSSTEIVLFSPAFPSFDQFTNYIERGEEFKKIFS